MHLDEAYEIVDSYINFYLVVGNKLNMLFLNNIPESLLPFSKNKIMEAVNLVLVSKNIKYGEDKKEHIKELATELITYIDDEKALTE